MSNNNYVKSFDEKPKLQDPVNIGFYILNKYTFNKFYNPKYELEDQFLRNLIKKKMLNHILTMDIFLVLIVKRYFERRKIFKVKDIVKKIF